MRHLARSLTTSFRSRDAGDRSSLGSRTRVALHVVLALSPALVVVVANLTGARFGAGFYGQVWLLPLLIFGVRWGFTGALVGAVLALAALNPPGLSFALTPQVHSSVIEWFAQAALYTVVVGLVGTYVGRGQKQSAQRDSFVDGPYPKSAAQLADSDRVLASLANTVEIRDHHTQGHCRRVARNAVVVGTALGLDGDDLRTLHWAATLHDLGKIAVPEYILLKSGRLSEEEYAEIRRHPMYGADLLASVSQSYRPIADVVRAHHERWDGFGYPLGFKGDEIPEMARIIAIVDVFEALTSERPYRSPMPEIQALQYIKNGAGSQFDPRLVEVFEALYLRSKIECAGTSPTHAGMHFAKSDRVIAQNA